MNMIENPNNIWKNMENIPNKLSKKELFQKRIKIIDQIEKEKNEENLDENGSNTNNSTNNYFINKKRGRKLKNITGNKTERTHDRNSDDNLKRKIKTHYHNYIIALLNSKLIVNEGEEKIKFGKIDSKITQNITVEYNKTLFNKKIKDIIKDVSNKYQNKNINLECINYIIKNSQINSLVIYFLNMTYKDMYINYYLKSTKNDFKKEPNESYESHKEKLKKLYGEEYLKNYIKNAENLIDFYNHCKKRKTKKINNNEIKNKDSSSSIELDENIINKDNVSYYFNEQNINNNYENDIINNNKISRSTQTETIQTEDESEIEY